MYRRQNSRCSADAYILRMCVLYDCKSGAIPYQEQVSTAAWHGGRGAQNSAQATWLQRASYSVQTWWMEVGCGGI